MDVQNKQTTNDNIKEEKSYSNAIYEHGLNEIDKKGWLC